MTHAQAYAALSIAQELAHPKPLRLKNTSGGEPLRVSVTSSGNLKFVADGWLEFSPGEVARLICWLRATFEEAQP